MHSRGLPVNLGLHRLGEDYLPAKDPEGEPVFHGAGLVSATADAGFVKAKANRIVLCRAEIPPNNLTRVASNNRGKNLFQQVRVAQVLSLLTRSRN